MSTTVAHDKVAEVFTALTVIPCVDGPEYREYTVGRDELPAWADD